MEKGIEDEESNLYKQTDNLADNVTDKLSNISSNINLNKGNNSNSFKFDFDYNKLANAIARALTNCKFTLDEDGFARIIKDELYKVV